MLKGFSRSNLISNLKQNSINDELKGSSMIANEAIVYRKKNLDEKENKRFESNPQVSSILVSNVENNKIFKQTDNYKETEKEIIKEHRISDLFEENVIYNNNELKYPTYFFLKCFKCIFNQETISGYAVKIKKIKKLIDVKLFNYFLLEQYYSYYKK